MSLFQEANEEASDATDIEMNPQGRGGGNDSWEEKTNRNTPRGSGSGSYNQQLSTYDHETRPLRS